MKLRRSIRHGDSARAKLNFQQSCWSETFAVVCRITYAKSFSCAAGTNFVSYDSFLDHETFFCVWGIRDQCWLSVFQRQKQIFPMVIIMKIRAIC